MPVSVGGHAFTGIILQGPWKISG